MGDRLGKALRVAGIGVGEMAEVLGVSRETVGRYLHGRTTPPRAALMVWAARTGVPLHWLETGEEKPAPGGWEAARAAAPSSPRRVAVGA